MESAGLHVDASDPVWCHDTSVLGIEEEVIEEYERIGDRNYLVALLGETALNKSRLGRPEEALEIVAKARRIGSEEDITGPDQARPGRGACASKAGRTGRGQVLARIRADQGSGNPMTLVNDEIDLVEGEWK